MKRNNINIGEDYWIIWVPSDPKNALDIDELLEPTWVFWQQLETQCVAECCSIYAFSFWADDIKRAISKLDKSKFLINIDNLKQQVAASKFHSVSSKKFNDTIEKSVFLRLLTHIEHSLKGWVN
jgi:hypothetical protein